MKEWMTPLKLLPRSLVPYIKDLKRTRTMLGAERARQRTVTGKRFTKAMVDSDWVFIQYWRDRRAGRRTCSEV